MGALVKAKGGKRDEALRKPFQILGVPPRRAAAEKISANERGPDRDNDGLTDADGR